MKVPINTVKWKYVSHSEYTFVVLKIFAIPGVMMIIIHKNKIISEIINAAYIIFFQRAFFTFMFKATSCV